MSTLRKPYKVAVVGPGGLGSCSIREIIRLPETELVAVLAYSPDKQGIDAGTLAGTSEIGIKATTNVEDFLKTDCDVVIYTARDYGDWRADNEILRLLEAGHNVITPLPYHYIKARGPETHARFTTAAKKGNSTLFGTGITPGFFNERLAMLMTGLSNDVDLITAQEFINCEHLSEAQLPLIQVIGLGQSETEAAANPIAAIMAENYLTQPIHFAADKLGYALEKIERTSHYGLVQDQVNTPIMTIDAGKVGLVNHSWTGYADGKPFYRTEVFWYMGEAMQPENASGDDFWTVTIEGRPSLYVTVQAQASFAKNLFTTDDEPAQGGYITTVMAMMQAIPAVVDAPAGLMLPDMPQFHWKKDMRIGH